MSLTWRSTILSLTIPAWKLQPNACWQVAVRWSVHVERHCQCYSLSTSYRMWQPPIAEHHRSLVERAVRSLQYCPAIIIRRSRARLTVHCRTRSRDSAGCRRGQTTVPQQRSENTEFRRLTMPANGSSVSYYFGDTPTVNPLVSRTPVITNATAAATTNTGTTPE